MSFEGAYCFRCSKLDTCDIEYKRKQASKYCDYKNTKIKTYPAGTQQLKHYSRYFEVLKDPDNKPDCYLPYSKEIRDFIKTGEPDKVRTQEMIDKSFDTSVSRTKQEILNIARSNDWDYFLTITFSPDYFDRTDYETISKKLTQFLNNLRKRYCPDIKYCLVPELHADRKSFHFHGIISNCSELTFNRAYNPHNNEPIFIDGLPIYNIKEFEKFGFNTASPVRDTDKVAGYIIKYITKELGSVTMNKKRYWCSKNVNRPKEEFTKFNPYDFKDMLCDNADRITYADTKVNYIGDNIMITNYVELNALDPSQDD